MDWRTGLDANVMLMSTEAKRDIEMKMSQIYILVINKAWNSNHSIK